MKGMIAAVAACICIPAVAVAQSPQRHPSKSHTQKTQVAKTASAPTSSRASTSGSSAAESAELKKAYAEQQDPKLIGSPAWWEQHATADGKPKKP